MTITPKTYDHLPREIHVAAYALLDAMAPYSWEVEREKARLEGREVETPKRIVPKKKRSRNEITAAEVKFMADCIIQIVGDGALSKGEIVKELGETPRVSVWNKAIALALESKKLQVNGQKKGARYSKYGTQVTIKRLMPESNEVVEAKDEILKVLESFRGIKLSRSEVFTKTGTLEQSVWIMAVKELISEGKIVQTGIKRGAKYEVV